MLTTHPSPESGGPVPSHRHFEFTDDTAETHS
jgi:hypothetical protein